MSKESVVQEWNELYPPGTKIELTNDDGEVELTKTRSIAWLLGDGTPVVSVDGRSGGYLLERIKPVEASTIEKVNYQWIRQVAIAMGMPFDEVRDKAAADLGQLFAELKAFIQKKVEARYDNDYMEMVKGEAKEAERKRIIAWGAEPCPHWAMYPDVNVIKRDCSQCWEELKSE